MRKTRPLWEPASSNSTAGVLWFQPGSSSTTFSFANSFILNGGTIRGEDGIQRLATTSGAVFEVGSSGGTVQATWSGKDVYIDGLMTGSGPLTLSHGPTGGQAAVIHVTNGLNTYSGTLGVSGAGNGITLDVDSLTTLQYATVNLDPGTPGTMLLNAAGNTLIAGLTGSAGTVKPAAVAGAYNLTLDNSSDVTFGGTLIDNTGTLALTKNGPSTLTLTGASTYSGGTTINAGTLRIGNNTATGSTGTGNIVDNAALIFSRSDAAFSYGGVISGSGSVAVAGSGTIALTGSSTYSGVTTISGGGVLNVGSLANVDLPSAIGHGSAAGSAADLVIDGGTLRYTGTTPASTNRLFTVGVNGATFDASGTANGSLTLGSAGGSIAFTTNFNAAAVTLTGSGTGTAAGTLSASLGDSGGFGLAITSLTKSGAGTWNLNANNTFTGATTISGGSLYLNGTNTTPTIGVAAGATLGGSGSAARPRPRSPARASSRPAPAGSGVSRSIN